MTFYDDGNATAARFEAGIQFALERMLVDPDFLLRVYRDPPKPPQPSLSAQRIGCPTSSSRPVCRSSCGPAFPDDQLLTLAEQRKLSDPAVLEQQVRRMLADPRSTRRWSTISPRSG